MYKHNMLLYTIEVETSKRCRNVGVVPTFMWSWTEIYYGRRFTYGKREFINLLHKAH
nr:MAG TPA: hypothetical protein [Caudoviricetes sp.]